jgi:4-hydroxythreonine-4-phosphate dehydrogenase
VIVDIDARRTAGIALTNADAGAVDFVKIDSLLRGPVVALIVGARARGRAVVLCNAVPSLGRTVVEQRTRVDGVDLADTDLWRVEPVPAPRTTADLLAPIPVAAVDARSVRGPAPELVTHLRTALSRGAVVSADAETDRDLDRIVAAAADVGALLVGAGGLFGAWVRTLPPRGPAAAGRVPPAERVLVVVGSASTAAREQVAMLDPKRVRITELKPEQLATWAGSDAPAAGEDAVEVLCIAPEPWPYPAELSRALARLAGSRATEGSALVLVGGETARNTLEVLGVGRLHAQRAVHYGALLCVADDGRKVIVRPGSFGSRAALGALIDAAAGSVT